MPTFKWWEKRKSAHIPSPEQRKLEAVQDEMIRHLEYLAAIVKLQRRENNPGTNGAT